MKKFAFAAVVLCAALSFASCNKHSDKPNYYLVATTFSGLDKSMIASDVYGENLYGKGYYWLDPVTGLGSKPVGDQYYSGGVAVSHFPAVELKKEDAANWYKYQMAVEHTNQIKYPGVDNSEFCLVSFGYSDASGWNYAPIINFTDSDTTTRVIEGLYICNTSYAVAQMTTDLGSGVPMTKENGGWFKVKFIGLDKDGKETGKVEAYLANYKTFGMLQGWNAVPLYTLGRVHGLKIDMESSDNGSWGMNTPAYVALDGIVVRVDKGTTVTTNKANIMSPIPVNTAK